MAHKDLSEDGRYFLEYDIKFFLEELTDKVFHNGESMALAREHLINIFPNAFDKAAEELEATDAKE